MPQAKQGDTFKYISAKYKYNFTLLSINLENVYIIVEENDKIFRIKKAELEQNIKTGYVKKC